METAAKRPLKDDQAAPGSWSWLKEWTGYLVTLLPYVSAGIVLINSIPILVKGAILFVFAAVVLAIRVLHEKAGIEVTGPKQKAKRPHAG
ncbi:MAG: hypothetical protein ABR508_05475 [Candidatus Baltobacteraceae bacterium]